MQNLQGSTKQVLQLQRNWQSNYIEKRSHPSRIQGCNKYPPIQTERESSSLWVSDLFYCQLLGKSLQESCPTEPIEWTPWTVRASTRKLIWIPEGQTNIWHRLHSKTASIEMPGTECGLLHDLCRPYQSIWHSQSLGTMENCGKVWLSCQLHSNGAAFPRWYDRKGPKWWQLFWSMACDKSI